MFLFNNNIIFLVYVYNIKKKNNSKINYKVKIMKQTQIRAIFFIIFLP